MKTRLLLSIVSLVLALGFSARAALVWENSTVDLHPTLSDKTAVAHFRYKNTGDKPIKITQVHPSCGCTTAAPPKDAVTPGGGGEIVATFTIGERSGEQTKTIQVQTDEPKTEATVLTLKATIPRLLEYKPVFLYWQQAAKHEPKTIEVKIGDFPVTKLDVTSSDPAVKVETAALPGGKAFRITVTPDPGNRPVSAELKIQPDFPKETPRTFYANVRVDAPGAMPEPLRIGPHGVVAGFAPIMRAPVAVRPAGAGAGPSATASPATVQTPPK